MVVVEVGQRFWRRGSLIYNSEEAAISGRIFVPGKNLPFLSTRWRSHTSRYTPATAIGNLLKLKTVVSVEFLW